MFIPLVETNDYSSVSNFILLGKHNNPTANFFKHLMDHNLVLDNIIVNYCMHFSFI